MNRSPHFAVILSGCGRADGSEIHEATLALLAIDKSGCTYSCFAPNTPQRSVVNHFTSTNTNEERNVLEESARIARGNIRDLSELKVEDFDCILLPGGLGAITNWCDFQTKGMACDVNSSLEEVLKEAYVSQKVIGAMCIAPMLLAKVLGHHGITITIGNDKKLAQIITEIGAKSQDCDAISSVVDKDNLIVTTPAYMLANSIKEVAIGAESLVNSMIELANNRLMTK
ncbi:MAG: isoprenoid biosynthesis glyoxalase ElbB [Alphaproteobacteria bacterium]|nr:isoprenoid biosynthesis glyoxalase ElbB [Alphaproteobacteria bacterium]